MVKVIIFCHDDRRKLLVTASENNHALVATYLVRPQVFESRAILVASVGSMTSVAYMHSRVRKRIRKKKTLGIRTMICGAVLPARKHEAVRSVVQPSFLWEKSVRIGGGMEGWKGAYVTEGLIEGKRGGGLEGALPAGEKRSGERYCCRGFTLLPSKTNSQVQAVSLEHKAMV